MFYKESCEKTSFVQHVRQGFTSGGKGTPFAAPPGLLRSDPADVGVVCASCAAFVELLLVSPAFGGRTGEKVIESGLWHSQPRVRNERGDTT